MSPLSTRQAIRHGGIKWILLILVWIIPAIIQQLHAQSSSKPNLLFLMTDQQRFDAMSCAGNSVVETPNMDRLAREGVFFENAYVANPVCTPSRSSFLTGLSCENTKVYSNRDYTSQTIPDVPTFDRVLKENGYTAEYYGKWHSPHQFAVCYDNEMRYTGNHIKGKNYIRAYQAWLADKGIEQKKPGKGELYSGRFKRPYTPIELDHSHEQATHSVDEKMKIRVSQASQYGLLDIPSDVSFAAFTANEALDALDHLKDQAFTLTCSFDPPHPPMVVQEPYYSMYPPADIPIPISIADPMTYSPYKERSEGEAQMRYRSPEDVQQMRSIYYGMVKEVDDWIGEILDKLDALGLTENTLVIFTSDHGEMLGDHGMHSKMIFYEGSVHVPLLMRFPRKIKPGTVVAAPVSALDLFSTILDYMDMPIPPSNGVSLRPFIEGKDVEHDVVAFSSGTRTPNYMIRSGNMKLMIGSSPNNRGIDAMYDLAADPLEMRNLLLAPLDIERDRKRARVMKERLIQWMETYEPTNVEAIRSRKIY